MENLSAEKHDTQVSIPTSLPLNREGYSIFNVLGKGFELRFNVKGNKLIGHTCYFCSQLLQLPSRRSFPKCSQSCLSHRNRTPFWCFPHSRVRSRECRSRMSRKSRLTSRRKTTGWSRFRRRMNRRYCCIRMKIPMTIRIRYFQTTTDHFRPHQTWKRRLERYLLEACSRAKKMKSPFPRHPLLAAHRQVCPSILF